MRAIILRFIINAIAVAVIASGLLPGIRIEGDYWVTLAFTSLAIGFVNAIVRPIVVFLTCPIVLFTLGFALLLINGAMLYLVSALTNWLDFLGGRLIIENFGWAVLGALIVSIINIILERVTGLKGNGRGQRVKTVYVQGYVEQQRSQYDSEFNRYLQNPHEPRRPGEPNDPFQ